MTSIGGSPGGPRIAAALLGIVVLVVLVLLFVVLYVAIQPTFDALLAMGVVALVLALLSYFAQSFSRDPTIQRSVSWGLGAMGFAILFLTIWFIPAPGGLSLASQLEGSLLLTLVLAVTLGLAYWRLRATAATAQRLEHRAQWDASPTPSAFDYAAAQTPGTGTVGGPPTTSERRP